ncbi:MAG: hypothetical protein NXI04_00290 [Planctomycetaceae bacterium]|nr:hypothetical protein [Planctomycetaceae bacterium]
MRTTTYLRAAGLMAVLAFALMPSTSAQMKKPTIKVVEHIWGFDGRVQPGQFNPLSVLLDNQTDEAVELTATLQRSQNLLNRSGGRYTESVFLAPAARRWVMFYPYVANSLEADWTLTINGGDGVFRNQKVGEFQQPRVAIKTDYDDTDPLPQVVILDPVGRFSSRPASLKHLPEEVFPPYATATFGLHSVFLDHVPDWEQPRQAAFMAWLKNGGRLHLLNNPRNERPRFTGELSDLNQPMSRFSIGSGVVVRHEIQREDVTEDLVRRNVVLDVLKGPLDEIEQELENNQQNYGMSAFTDSEPSSVDDELFRRMRELTFPDHNWALIFLLALCYIGLIFPGCYLLSKKKELHFLTTYGAIVGLSVMFSLIFLFIGRRGYGESTTLQTLAIARAEDNKHWSVFQWNALFVTSGDEYSAFGGEQQGLFSTANTMDEEEVVIQRGLEAQIRMRIPPFTSQTFVSRRRISSDDWGLKVTSADVTPDSLVNLKMSTGPGFPGSATDSFFALYGRRIYELSYDPAQKRLVQLGKRQYLAKFCAPKFDFTNQWAPAIGTTQQADTRTEAERFFDDSLPRLARRSLLDDLTNRPREFELPPDRIRILAYTEIPEEFLISVSAPTQNSGRILFVKDVLLNDQSALITPQAGTTGQVEASESQAAKAPDSQSPSAQDDGAAETPTDAQGTESATQDSASDDTPSTPQK